MSEEKTQMINSPPPDGEQPLFEPSGHRIHYPHSAIPNWVSLSPIVDARALGFYGVLRTHVNESRGVWETTTSARDLGARLGIDAQQIDRSPNPKGKGLARRGGLVQRLAEAGAVTRHRRWTKTRQCVECHTPKAQECLSWCENTKGRVRAHPEYRIASEPPGGHGYVGPLNLGEYKHPEVVLERMEAVASLQSPLQQIFPFGYAMTWVLLHPDLDLIDLAIYVFLAAHASLADAQLDVTVLRERVADRLEISPSRVTDGTAALEAVGAIAKKGLHVSVTGRRVGNLRATTYVLQVAPPKEMWHPHALDVNEWRKPSLIKQRHLFQVLERARLRRERDGVGDVTPPDGVSAGQGGPSMGYPQGDSGSVMEPPGDPVDNPSDDSAPVMEPPRDPVDNSSDESPHGGYPQASRPGDVTPDLRFVDNSEGDGTPEHGCPQSRGGLNHWDEGVTSLGSDITRYLLTTYGGAVSSVDSHPQGRSAGLRLVWTAARDVVALALERLPVSATPLSQDQDRESLVASVADRIMEGYTPVQLFQALTVSTAGVRSAWALTVRAAYPSRWLDQQRQAPVTAPSVRAPWCGRCESDAFRFLTRGDQVRRCPACHPNAGRPWMPL